MVKSIVYQHNKQSMTEMTDFYKKIVLLKFDYVELKVRLFFLSPQIIRIF